MASGRTTRGKFTITAIRRSCFPMILIAERFFCPDNGKETILEACAGKLEGEAPNRGWSRKWKRNSVTGSTTSIKHESGGNDGNNHVFHFFIFASRSSVGWRRSGRRG